MNEQVESSKKKSRSPNYPGISLGDAIAKAAIVWEREKKHPAGFDVISKHWNSTPTSSGFMKAVAALLKYGLLEEIESKLGRQAHLTQRALRILLGESAEKKAAMKEAALSPKIFRELWDRFGEHLPSNDSLKNKLILDFGFNATATDGFIKDFKDTIELAELRSGDSVAAAFDGDEDKNADKGVFTPSIPDGENKNDPPVGNPPSIKNLQNVLAQYTIPLGANQATLVFTGDQLTPDDFDALKDFVEFSKKQFVRAAKTTSPVPQASQQEEP